MRCLSYACISAGLLLLSASAQAETTGQWQYTSTSWAGAAVYTTSTDNGPSPVQFGMFCKPKDGDGTNRMGYYVLFPGEKNVCPGTAQGEVGGDQMTVKMGDRFTELGMTCQYRPNVKATVFWTAAMARMEIDELVAFENRFNAFKGNFFSVEFYENPAKPMFSNANRALLTRFQKECAK